MLKGIRNLLGLSESQAAKEVPLPREAPPNEIAAGASTLRIADHLVIENGIPHVQWDAVYAWLDTLSDEAEKARAWGLCERAWLLHLGNALGDGYHLAEGREALVLSSLSERESRNAVAFMERTLKRVCALLPGIARGADWGKDILVVLDDDDRYYGYVSHFHEEGGDYSLSSGMHISDGCSHFVTTKSTLGAMEPVIAHEMAHGCVTHLTLPLWLNEGIAVNTEFRLTGSGGRLLTPVEMHEKHRKFWGDGEIQEFWSGKSFRRHDDGNMLSYDLARAMVEQFSSDWDAFAAFVAASHWDDGGAGAAREHLGVELGACVRAMLEHEPTSEWEPRPDRWGAGERETVPA